MLVKKMQIKKGKKIKIMSEKNIRPTKPDPQQTNAIIEVGFTERPDLVVKNPFIQRQHEIAEERKLKQIHERLDRAERNGPDLTQKFKMTVDSLQPHLSSTFNVSIPFKDTLLSNFNTPSTHISTVYAKEGSGFLFGSSKPENSLIKPTLCESPTLRKYPKLEVKEPKRLSLPRAIPNVSFYST